MAWTIEYDPGAIDDLNALPRAARSAVYRYLQQRIAGAAHPRLFGKPLRHRLHGLWRYRVTDYRIVCELQDARQVVLVVAVGDRKDVYGRNA